jgi:hypothetical protein
MRLLLRILLVFNVLAIVCQAEVAASPDGIRTQLPLAFVSGWDQLVVEYFKMKDALVADNTWGASMAAGRLHLGLSGIETDGLLPAHMRDWVFLRLALRGPADQIAGASSLTVQRQYFQLLSEAMLRGVFAIGAGSYHIYVLRCPMADQGRGANWLSQQAEVQNPYFGIAMLQCGKRIAQAEGKAAAPTVIGDALPGRLTSPVMHGCHGPGR